MNSNGKENCSNAKPGYSCPHCSALHLEIACPAKNAGLPAGRYNVHSGGGNGGRGRGGNFRGRRMSNYKKGMRGAGGGGAADANFPELKFMSRVSDKKTVADLSVNSSFA